MATDDLVKIGELCAGAGVTPRTVRHYECEGLIQAAGNTPGGQKLYNRDAVEAIRAVKTLQDIGMSIKEIRRLFGRAEGPPTSDKRLTNHLRSAVKTVDINLQRRIDELLEAKARVAAVVDSTNGCDTCGGTNCAECGVLTNLRTLGVLPSTIKS
jgi:DNA-binding transcriptional MerR regulator